MEKKVNEEIKKVPQKETIKNDLIKIVVGINGNNTFDLKSNKTDITMQEMMSACLAIETSFVTSLLEQKENAEGLVKDYCEFRSQFFSTLVDHLAEIDKNIDADKFKKFFI